MIGTYRRSLRRYSARTQEGDLPTHQQFDAIDWRELNARGSVGRKPALTGFPLTSSRQAAPNGTATKVLPPSRSTSSSTDLRPALPASAIAVLTSRVLWTGLSLTETMTSPDWMPAAAADLSGSTLATTAPLTARGR